jgi:hypothetical protein
MAKIDQKKAALYFLIFFKKVNIEKLFPNTVSTRK